ncbi:CRPV-387 [Crowpox virus]|nr:CRPV-387 [Crowpox virus]
MIELLVKNGIDKSIGRVNWNNFTVDMYNVIKSHIDNDHNAVIFGKTLIQGADINRVSPQDQTPNVAILEKLIDAGTEVKLSNDWKNALYYAVLERKKYIVRLLLNNGAKPLLDKNVRTFYKGINDLLVIKNENLKSENAI